MSEPTIPYYVLKSRVEQLEHELNEVKGGWHRVSDERDQLKSKLFRTEDEREEWRTMAQELAKVAIHIGYTSCEDGQVIQAAERVIARFNELKKATHAEI